MGLTGYNKWIKKRRTLQIVITLIIVTLLYVSISLTFLNHPPQLLKIRFESYEVCFTGLGYTLMLQISSEEITDILDVLINGTRVKWLSESDAITRSGTKLMIFYPNLTKGKYAIEIRGRGVKGMLNIHVGEEELKPSVLLQRFQYGLGFRENEAILNIAYNLDLKRITYLRLFVFAYKDYHEEGEDRKTYILYSPSIMSEKTLQYIDALVTQGSNLGLEIKRIDLLTLSKLAANDNDVTLIIFNPLYNASGYAVTNVLPSVLVDPNENGFPSDDSESGFSYFYDLMNERGWVIMIVNSTQPNKYILLSDGRTILNREKQFDNDADRTLGGLTHTMWGHGGVGSFVKNKISETLNLKQWGGEWGFDIKKLEEKGAKFYSYGDHILSYERGVYNISLPAFIKVGKGGFFLTGETAWDKRSLNDLLMILHHRIWSSEWLEKGWLYDSATKTYAGYGCGINISDQLQLKFPYETPKLLRLLIIGYSADEDRIVKEERILEIF